METQVKALTILLSALGAFCLWEFRVFSTNLNILRAICSGHGYPTPRAANTSCPRSNRFWLLELRVSRTGAKPLRGGKDEGPASAPLHRHLPVQVGMSYPGNTSKRQRTERNSTCGINRKWLNNRSLPESWSSSRNLRERPRPWRFRGRSG